jgi:WD40 repeat protein
VIRSGCAAWLPNALATTDVRRVGTLAEGVNAFCLAFSPNGRRLAIGPHNGLGVCKVLVYDVAARRLAYELGIPSSTTETRQTGVRALACSPDGRWLAAGTRNGELHLWDTAASVPQRTFRRAHKAEVKGLAFHPSGRWLVSCSDDMTVAIWQTPDWRERARHTVGEQLSAVTFSYDGSRLLCGFRPTLPLPIVPGLTAFTISGATTELIAVPYHMIAHSSDGRTVAVVNVDRRLRLTQYIEQIDHDEWPTFDPDGRLAHKDEVKNVEFVAGGALVLSAGMDRTVQLWDVLTGRLSVVLLVEGTGNVFATGSASGGLLAATDDDRTVLYELSGPNVVTPLAPHGYVVRAIAWAGGSRLVGLGQSSRHDHHPHPIQPLAWDLVEGQTTCRPMKRNSDAWCSLENDAFVAIHPAGIVMAFGSENSRGIQAWDAQSRAWRQLGSTEPSAAATFSPDGDTLWAGFAENAEVVAYRWPELTIASRWSNAAAQQMRGNMRIHAVAAGRRWVLAGSRDRYVKLLRSADGQLEREWPGPGGSVRKVGLSPDEKWAAAGTEHGEVQIARLPGGETVAAVTAHTGQITALAFHPAGRRLVTASAGDAKVRLWDWDGKVLREVATLPATGPVVAAEFSPDGAKLAVLARDEHAPRVWHLDRLQSRLVELGLGW